MIKEDRYFKWKSFREAVLYIDPVTVVIGANASGKSNALDGLSFLNLISLGKDFQTALADEPKLMHGTNLKGVRGGIEWAAMKPFNQFTLEALIQKAESIDYLYSITVNIHPVRVEVQSESLTRFTYTKSHQQSSTTRLYWTDAIETAGNIRFLDFVSKRQSKKLWFFTGSAPSPRLAPWLLSDVFSEQRGAQGGCDGRLPGYC